MAHDHETYSTSAQVDPAMRRHDPGRDGSLTRRTARSAPTRDNVVVMPTFYTGTHARNEGYLRAVSALDPSRWFIVSINMFGNGLSSSPSNTAPPFDGPAVSPRHRARQRRLPAPPAHRGARREDASRWCSDGPWPGARRTSGGRSSPTWSDAILPFCASARTSPHNQVFLEGVKAALTGRPRRSPDGDYSSPPEAGLKSVRTGLRGLGVLPDLLPRAPPPRARIPDLGRAAARLGARSSRLGRQRPAGQAPYLAARRHQRRRSLSAETSRAHSAPSGRGRSWSPAPRISTSRPRTTQSRPNTCRTRSFGPSHSPWGHCVATPSREDSDFMRFLDGCASALLTD